MSTPAVIVTPSKTKAKKVKDKDKPKDKEKAQLPGERLKIVVRRLPPNLPEEIFWQSVANWVTDETVSWRAYFAGKPRKRANKENVPSRAYIAFKTIEQLLNFSRDYDGHKFIDKAGTESYAVVEYAPYQKVPGEKKKPDSRHATIEKDEDYISFLESLKAPTSTEPVTIETLVASIRPPSPPKTTPLLEALKAEKQAQKDKEAIIRNHAHYKEIMNGSPAALKKEEKRKAARAEAARVAGKKGKKAAPPPSAPAKPVQIQANTSAASAQNGNTAPTASAPAAKTQPSPARPSRKHATKPSKEAAPASTSASATPKDHPPAPATATKSPVPAPAQVHTPDNATPPASAPARRGRPVLGLGSRHFEAALSGVGVAGGRKRGEKDKEANPATTVPSQDSAPKEKQNPPSPKRSRHKPSVPTSTAAARPDANGASVLPVPAIVQGDGGGSAPAQTNGTPRGGKRGRGGRGRGGPSRGG